MAGSKAKVFALGAPILAGGAVLVTAAPAFADGPTETASTTHSFTDNNDQIVSCTVTLSLVTNYQNEPKRGFAGWSITDTPACRNAFVVQDVRWITAQNGGGVLSQTYNSPIPASDGDAVSPLNPNVRAAQLSERLEVTFGNCLDNCQMLLSLTADGKA